MKPHIITESLTAGRGRLGRVREDLRMESVIRVRESRTWHSALLAVRTEALTPWTKVAGLWKVENEALLAS
jgi:hypothetical protein